MGRTYFGTDGIRGRANGTKLNAATAMRVGQAAGRHFLRGDHKHRVVIGKDTRLSGYMMENALVAGFTSVGMDCTMTGPLPTPAAPSSPNSTPNSAASPATSVISGPRAPSRTGGGPKAFGPALNIGVIRVWRKYFP